MNRFLKILLFSCLMLSVALAPQWLEAGEISRKTDFYLNVSQETRGNEHGSESGLPGPAWSYWLAPDYYRFLDKESGNLDYGKLLNCANLRPVQIAGDMTFQTIKRNEKGRLCHDYSISAEGVSLYWSDYTAPSGNSLAYDAKGTNFQASASINWKINHVPPHSELSCSAVVIKFRVPKAGRYSLRGNLSYLSEQPAKDAVFTVGVLRKPGFSLLFTHVFGQETPASESKLFKVLDQEPSVQNQSLALGDEIIFFVGSPNGNSLKLNIIDDDVRIVSEDLPPGHAISKKARVLSLLNFASPDLVGVKAAYETGRIDDAFEKFKAVLAERVSALPPVVNFGFWIHGSAKADELLNGVLTTGHYGLLGTTTYSIGKPGSVDWFKVPEDGYDVILRDLATMQWSNKLAEAYARTGEKRYLDCYLGYWSDFAVNWYPSFQSHMRDAKFRKRLGGDSISWSANSRLYNAWRLDTLVAGLYFVFRRAKADSALAAVSNDKLAAILTHLYFWETPRSMRFLLDGGGVPNQQQHLAGGMFGLSVILSDMKGAALWQKAALDNILVGSGYLPDGTDMEQSFNYNKGLYEKLERFTSFAPALPASQRGDWLPRMREMEKYRDYFMHAIVMPMTGQPICGNNNTWPEYSTPVKLMPGITDAVTSRDFSKLPLSAAIKDRFYGGRKMPEPTFRSVYFPYGGYYALRSDWTPDALYNFMKVSRPGRGHMREENNAVTFCALGRQLLINSGANPYSPKTIIPKYGLSSISQNTIAVDGYGQQLNFEACPPAAYDTPLNYRFLDGKHFSFAEGVYDSAYGEWNFMDQELDGKKVVRDVRHARQVILLRDEKLWIVTDIVRSEQEHCFTQIWNFPPDFAPDQVSATNGVISTNRPDDVNIALYQFIDGPLVYAKYHGSNASGRTLGWVAMPDKATGLDATPAVDIHCSWRGKGQQILITVIVPFKGGNPVHGIRALRRGKAEGVEVTLKDGRNVEYLYGTDNAEAVLKTNNAMFTIIAGGGCETDAGTGARINVIVPTGFRWESDGISERPSYH